MKVYTLVVISMESLCVTHEESYEYEGDVVLCKGPSGSISYPDYMERIHVQWLTGGTRDVPSTDLTPSLETVMGNALIAGGNPYFLEEAFDPRQPDTLVPGSPLKHAQLRHDALDTFLGLNDDETDYINFVNQAITRVDAAYVTEAEITSVVSVFETEVRARRLAELSVHTGGMADINAVVGSQFVIGMALIESNITQEVNRFERELRIRLKEHRGNLIDSAVKIMAQMLQVNIGAEMNATRLQAEVVRLRIVAQKEQIDRDLEIDALDATWDLHVFRFGSNLLGVLGGNTMPNIKQPSTVQSVLGGAVSGAAAGAQLTGGNPVGVGIGALAGGISGFLG